jgi:hypothetical protein
MSGGKKKRGHSQARALQRKRTFDQRRGRKPGRLSLHKHPLRFDVAIFAMIRPTASSDQDAAELALILDDNSVDFAWISRIVNGQLWNGFASTYQGGYGDEIKPAKIVAGRAVRKFDPETIGNSSSGRQNRRDYVAHEAPRLIEEARRTRGPALAWLVQSTTGLRKLLVAVLAGDIESRALRILVDVDPGWLPEVEHLMQALAKLLNSENAVESKR